MKWVIIIAVLFFSCNRKHKKSEIVERQKDLHVLIEINKEDIASHDRTMARILSSRYELLQDSSIFKLYQQLLNDKTKDSLLLDSLQDVYDSLEFELKKY